MLAAKKNRGILELEDLWPVVGILKTISYHVYSRNITVVISNNVIPFTIYTMVRSVRVAGAPKILKQQSPSKCVQREEGDKATRKESGHLQNNSISLQAFMCMILITKCITMSK